MFRKRKPLKQELPEKVARRAKMIPTPDLLDWAENVAEPDSVATYDDPVHDGWVRTVDGRRRWHYATGALVMRHNRGYWEVWSGPMDGATYLSVGLAVHAVETGRLA